MAGPVWQRVCQIILLSSFSWMGAYLGEKVIQEVLERKDIVSVKQTFRHKENVPGEVAAGRQSTLSVML